MNEVPTDDDWLARYVRREISRYPVPASVMSPRRARSTSRESFSSKHLEPGLLVIASAAVIFVVAISSQVKPPAPTTQLSQTTSPNLGAYSSSLPSISQSSGSPTAVDLSTSMMFDIQTIGPCPERRDLGLSDCAEEDAPRVATVVLTAQTFDGAHERSVSIELLGFTEPKDLDRARPVAFPGELQEVIYSANDQDGGALRSVLLATGSHEERFRSEMLIQDAAYDPMMGNVVAAFVSRGERRDAGIWRIDLLTTKTRRIVPPRTDLDFARRVNGWIRRVFVTPDSRKVVSMDCMDASCEARVYDAETGEVVSASAGLRDDVIFGVTDDALVGVFDCSADPCRLGTVSLKDGSLSILRPPCPYVSGALTTLKGRGMLGLSVLDSSECDPGAVVAVDVETGSSYQVWRPTTRDARHLQAIQGGRGLGYAAPPGWIALGPGGGFSPAGGEAAKPLLLALDDGTVVPILAP